MSLATSISIFAAVAAAHALAVVSPGPDFAVVVRNSLAGGRRAGLWTAAGIGSGICLHVAYGLFGLAWLSARFPQLLSWLGWGGAAVLLYLGVGALLSRPQPPATADAPLAAHRYYVAGFLTNALNPKAALFFVALFSAVIAGGGAPSGLKIALALWLPLTSFGWFATLATLLAHLGPGRWLQAHAHHIERAMGALLVTLGCGLIAGNLGI